VTEPDPDEATTFDVVPAPAAPGIGAVLQGATLAGVKPGDILNHIFKVERFIARGGMGEVFEGINIQTDERVAIKVMLPTLAADPVIQAMFRREARTLTGLSHPALVRYLLLAEEPRMGVLYIVTEFIEGSSLADLLGTAPRDAENLTALLRHLADGLRVAHKSGKIHRDIAPDNILLEGGRLDSPKVIDFGIAKDLDPDQKTIIGDGFAGKLSYVAPEQLGDFGREIGPWTDVYSLALIVLAVARGEKPDLGGSIVDAVDKRRIGPSLDVVPETLRPVLAKMLVPDPAKRLRSMADVLTELDTVAQGSSPLARVVSADVSVQEEQKHGRGPLLVGLGAAVLIGGGFGAAALLHLPPFGAAASGAATDEQVTESAKAAVRGATCAWLDLKSSGKDAAGWTFALKGVAGQPGAVRDGVLAALAARQAGPVKVGIDDVASIGDANCNLLDAIGPWREGGMQALRLDGEQVTMRPQANGVSAARISGTLAATPGDFSLVGIESDGSMTQVIRNRGDIPNLVAAKIASTRPDGSLKLAFDVTTAGWTGLMLVKGKGPFDAKLVAPPLSQRGPNWKADLAAVAKAKDWKMEMLWTNVLK